MTEAHARAREAQTVKDTYIQSRETYIETKEAYSDAEGVAHLIVALGLAWAKATYIETYIETKETYSSAREASILSCRALGLGSRV